ncbi:MAG: hypothetical protein H6718_03720 [Polyangiaceae bacterium]|nr:hypothetical protein [Myxococcales bacterium]MCB9584475.1 hypothetical protein [Polyangiaceae bacterium]MCB9609318.1 hypothetical protein [Polyangiaceae bacterium]
MHIRLSLVFAMLLVSLFGLVGCKGEPKPGEKEFHEANAKINVFEGEVGFGNTAACTALAKKFAVRIKADEKENFEGGEDENTATTKGNFMTYCQETPSDVLLLVRVPNLDTYSGDIRKDLIKLAWEALVELSADLRKAGEKKLNVALRGNLLYGGLASGAASGQPQLEMATSIDTAKFHPLFNTKK